MTFYVFEAARWLETPPGADEPVETDGSELAALLGPVVVDESSDTWPDAAVRARGPVLLRRDRDRLFAWDPFERRDVQLDGTDVAILSAAADTTVVELRQSFEEIDRRIGRLEAVGLVELSPEVTDTAAEMSEAPEDRGEPGGTPEVASARDDDSPQISEPGGDQTVAVAHPDPVPWTARRVVFGAVRRTRRFLVGRAARRRHGSGPVRGHDTDGSDEDLLDVSGVVVPAAEPSAGSERHVAAQQESSNDAVAVDPAPEPAAESGFAEMPAFVPTEVVPPADDGRIRVLASWDMQQWGQPLALGCLLAYAKVWRDGSLAERYDLRPLVSHEELLEELARRDDPAIVLFSDYIWSAKDNLDTAAKVKELGADHLVLHGGPHVPKYEEELRRHFERHEYIDVVSHGEGEITFAEFLETLDGDLTAVDRLVEVPGLTVRQSDGRVVSAVARERHDSLGDFPSPYLTGEFDHLDVSAWQWPGIETDRGCPYSCAFCDWGSATQSRVRTFPLERVLGELQWIADRGLRHWMINDANFGIHKRDVEITKFIVDLREKYGVPNALYVNYAKNTVKHLAQIIGMLTRAGITGEGALALQTRDPGTLKAIKRSNIRTDKYDELAAEFRKYGLPLITDLIIGLPGQTVGSFLDDLQYCADNDVTPRFFVALNLPNAEFNDPEYKKKFRMVLGDGDVVVETSSFSLEDRTRMMRLRMAYRCLEHFAIMRHVFRFLQWDCGIPLAEALDRIEARVHSQPDVYPLMSWLLNYLDIFLIVPYSWPAFYGEVRRLVEDEFEVDDGSALETVFAVQRALMPERDRTFPDRIDLQHDFGEWYRQNLNRGAGEGVAASLDAFGPGEFVVQGDPLFHCRDALRRLVDERPHELLVTPFWTTLNWELDSPVQRLVQETAVHQAAAARLRETA
jgi:radical SAM superfamily enzyme YgiQ (UPF0313 family)